MTQTPYILWAVLATGGAVAVYILMRREVAKAKRRADGNSDGWELSAASAERYRLRAIAAENALRDIKARRKASAKHARQAQLSQQRAKVLEQASKLVAPKALDIAA